MLVLLTNLVTNLVNIILGWFNATLSEGEAQDWVMTENRAGPLTISRVLSRVVG